MCLVCAGQTCGSYCAKVVESKQLLNKGQVKSLQAYRSFSSEYIKQPKACVPTHQSKEKY